MRVFGEVMCVVLVRWSMWGYVVRVCGGSEVEYVRVCGGGEVEYARVCGVRVGGGNGQILVLQYSYIPRLPTHE